MMSITDADRTLAAELGLLLEPVRETPRDQQLAADPRATRAPAHWLVKVARTRRLVGRLHFTPVDCLYATKLTAGISGIEETVADAIRWIAPVVRHVRTGAYAGSETIVLLATNKILERPRALTECDAKPSGADYSPIAARSTIANSDAGEMCPACRAKLEARGVHDLSPLPDRPSSASPRQVSFIRRLLDEAASCGRPYLLETRGLDRLSSRAASAKIDALKSLKARDWKGAL